MQKARTGSAHWPSGIPYSVYKQCPLSLRRLCGLVRILWKKGTTPEFKKRAEGCLIPKDESRTAEQIRTPFWLLNAYSLHCYSKEDQYVDTSALKGTLFRLHRSYQCPNQDDKRDKSWQRGPYCDVAWHGQYLWKHTTKAYWRSTSSVPCPRTCPNTD